MADGGFPNKNRAINAYDAYGDAMRLYIAQVLERVHGSGWVRLRLLTDDLRKNNGRRYDGVERALRSKKPPLEILDRGDIPNLVNGDLANFPDLSRDDARSLFKIRNLRNDIVHSGRSGDCTVEQANAIASLCVLALERCGLSDAAESIRRISLVATPVAQATPEADLREQRERREWDKARLAEKVPDELTPWEQQRRAEIEWEEEWERRELIRAEQDEIAGFGDDIDGLRSWFDADEARHGRHPSEHTTLLQQEQERREQREREQRKREREERERREQERKAHERREQERKKRERRERERLEIERRERKREREERKRRERELQERERTEIAALGDDIDRLRRWFDTYKIRPKRHPNDYASLIRREREREERELSERERAEIAAFGDDIDRLRRWFDTYKIRPKRHADEHASLIRRERERSEREWRDREMRERELAEIAALGSDIDGLRRWFAFVGRRNRHPSEYADLVRREQEQEQALRERERAEIAAFGDDIDGLRRWFAFVGRRNRHLSEYADLVRREQEQALRERERAEIAAFGDDIDGLRRWFDAFSSRAGHHASAYVMLRERELVRHERAEIAQFGNNIDRLRLWFNADRRRRPRHPSEYEELTRVESHWRHRLRARLLAAVGSVIAFVRDVFSVQRLRRDVRRLPRLLGSLILSFRTRKALFLAGSYLFLYSIAAVAGWRGFDAIIIWTVLLFCWFSAKRLSRSDPVHKRTK